MKIQIAIADDNNFLISTIREKLSFFNDLEYQFSALNGKELIRKLNQNPAIDLILMDIEMPIMNGIEATAEIKKRFPNIKIVMLTAFDNDENIFNAIKAGADGYLLKETKPEELHQGIVDTINGGAAMNPSIAIKTLRLLRNPIVNVDSHHKADITLTDRETEVLEQLAKGYSYSIIADNLIISSGTVRKHIENIYKKLQVHNKIEAIIKARNNNLID
ncbi:response regulator transcription factor [Weeksellaceae bacterium KMM 9713]|uniref:Response regulator transcription factor n=1 Tax=Profundicola chukchiensis TaxID=2961959 RepID=A0A9X4MYV4_9FLAO|nr:response regulator transcription factor [Profundicola chukchiensis]MDG4946683.1 response regulator transcription factor [Profundicola chukchiensis]